MKSSFGYRFALALSLFNSFSAANAVEITAPIEGTITDPSGAVIPNAQVNATNIDTGVVTTTTTSFTGDYLPEAAHRGLLHQCLGPRLQPVHRIRNHA